MFLDGQLPEAQVRALLEAIDFDHREAAIRRLQHMSTPDTREGLVQCMPHLLAALGDAATPDHVLVRLERLANNVPDVVAFFDHLAAHPRAVHTLVTLFAGSQFLTEILLRQPEYVNRLADPGELALVQTASQFDRQARSIVTPIADPDRGLDALRRWQRWELLRIGACDLFGLLDLPAVTQQLSHLADSLIRTCLSLIADADAAGNGLCVVALGKLGGEEINYSSDIDLLFLSGQPGSGFDSLGRRLISALSRITSEGFLYRVDMRLRPWGRSGPLVSSVDGYLDYLRDHARLWERQALLKARTVAGDDVGVTFLEGIRPLLVATAPEAVRAEVHGMKQRTEHQLRARGVAWGQVKQGEGSIRDVEFMTQYLQLVNGENHPQLLCANTLEALARLRQAEFLSAEDHRVLADGYTFLRAIEHHLQMMHYQQAHTLPDDLDELTQLARRLGFAQAQGEAQFLARYEEHRRAIRAVYERLLAVEPATAHPPHDGVDANTHSHLTRMHATYAQTFTSDEIAQHAIMAKGLGEAHLVELHAVPQPDGAWQVTIVGYDYLGELSLICGLFVVYGIDIVAGHVFTYEPSSGPAEAPALQPARPVRRRFSLGRRRTLQTRPKIVDVFTVRPLRGAITEETWLRYTEELSSFLNRMQVGRRAAAQGQLARRVAQALEAPALEELKLSPVDIEIDNGGSQHYTILRIDSADTRGFLYELTNALTLNSIYIGRVEVEAMGQRVHDTLYVTDDRGHKIRSAEQQRQLRAATVLVKHFTHLLPHAPDPAAALLHFRQFLGQTFARPNWTEELASLEQPEVLDALARLLGISDFLWDDFLRMQHANLFPLLRDQAALARAKSRDALKKELAAEVAPVWQDVARAIPALNAFKDREMFRIDMRHILTQKGQFQRFASELTDLAEVVVETAYTLCDEGLQRQFGTPTVHDADACPMAICALGKCGGRELGFASDIELMFVYAGNGTTSGPNVITTAEYFEKLVAAFLQAVQARREGVFEIDLQLRPYGKAGSMAVPLDAFRRYFTEGGPAWVYERQALVKLRPIAGDRLLGKRIVDLRDRFVYSGTPFDATAMRAMRERQVRHLVTAGTFNAKFSPGGLADLEYLVQGLQINHGQRHPKVRQTNTVAALDALLRARVIGAEDGERLRNAYGFLRQLIDAVRMVRGNAKDLTVPAADSEEFAFLARRLGADVSVRPLRDELLLHTLGVQDVSGRLLK